LKILVEIAEAADRLEELIDLALREDEVASAEKAIPLLSFCPSPIGDKI